MSSGLQSRQTLQQIASERHRRTAHVGGGHESRRQTVGTGSDLLSTELRATHGGRRTVTQILQGRASIGFDEGAYEHSREDFLEALVTRLEDRYGNLIRGWFSEFDHHGTLRCHFRQMCKGAASLGLHNVSLFPQGLIFHEVDADSCMLVEFMREWVHENYGATHELFKALNVRGDGFVQLDDFVEFVKGRQPSLDFLLDREAELFNGLDLDGHGTLTAEEVLFLESDTEEREMLMIEVKRQHEDERMKILAELRAESERRNLSMAHRLGERPWHADIGLPANIVLQRERVKRQQKREVMMHAVNEFRTYLHGCFGHEVRAWRRVLDPKGEGTLTKSSLRRFLRSVQFSANFESLWNALDRDGNGDLAIEEIAPKSMKELAKFRSWMHQECGTCASAWEKGPFREVRLSNKRYGIKKLLLEEFHTVLHTIGYPHAGELTHVNRCLRALDLDGCGFIHQSDLEWLDEWMPPEWLLAEPNDQHLEKVRRALEHEYGDALSYWRLALSNKANRVSWSRWKATCQKLRVGPFAAGAWRSLDGDCSGWLSLREVDGEAHQVLGSFKQWADKNFGSVAHVAEVAAAAQPHEGLFSLAKLQHLTRKYRWDGDARQLYIGLGFAGGGKGKVPVSDIGPQIALLDGWEEHPEEEEKQLLHRELSPPKAKPQRMAKSKKGEPHSQSVPELPSLTSKEEKSPSKLASPQADPLAAMSPRDRKQEMLGVYSFTLSAKAKHRIRRVIKLEGLDLELEIPKRPDSKSGSSSHRETGSALDETEKTSKVEDSPACAEPSKSEASPAKPSKLDKSPAGAQDSPSLHAGGKSERKLNHEDSLPLHHSRMAGGETLIDSKALKHEDSLPLHAGRMDGGKKLKASAAGRQSGKKTVGFRQQDSEVPPANYHSAGNAMRKSHSTSQLEKVPETIIDLSDSPVNKANDISSNKTFTKSQSAPDHRQTIKYMPGFSAADSDVSEGPAFRALQKKVEALETNLPASDPQSPADRAADKAKKRKEDRQKAQNHAAHSDVSEGPAFRALQKKVEALETNADETETQMKSSSSADHKKGAENGKLKEALETEGGKLQESVEKKKPANQPEKQMKASSSADQEAMREAVRKKAANGLIKGVKNGELKEALGTEDGKLQESVEKKKPANQPEKQMKASCSADQEAMREAVRRKAANALKEGTENGELKEALGTEDGKLQESVEKKKPANQPEKQMKASSSADHKKGAENGKLKEALETEGGKLQESVEKKKPANQPEKQMKASSSADQEAMREAVRKKAANGLIKGVKNGELKEAFGAEDGKLQESVEKGERAANGKKKTAEPGFLHKPLENKKTGNPPEMQKGTFSSEFRKLPKTSSSADLRLEAMKVEMRNGLIRSAQNGELHEAFETKK